MRKVVVVIVGLTGEEQGSNDISDALKREITQGLQERHGLDKGIAIKDTCAFLDFEVCEEINLSGKRVRCVPWSWRVMCVALCALVVGIPE